LGEHIGYYVALTILPLRSYHQSSQPVTALTQLIPLQRAAGADLVDGRGSGITKDESSRWQAVAAVPEDVRQEYVAEAKATDGEVTTTGLLKFNTQKRAEEHDALACDPFLGSGTTAVAAYKPGRRFIGGDRSSSYVESAKRRLAVTLSRARREDVEQEPPNTEITDDGWERVRPLV
jgi:hypothetical protein